MFLFVALSLAACGDGSPTAPTSEDFDLESSSAPSPALATPSTGVTYIVQGDDNTPDRVLEYDWITSFAVILRLGPDEVGLDVTRVNLTIRQASGGIVISPSPGEVERFEFDSQASGNRLNAGGEITVKFDAWYTLPNGGKEALVTVQFDFVNDDGFTLGETLDVRISP